MMNTHPSNWTPTLIVTTLKSGAPSLANNYRGISFSYKLSTPTVARRIELYCGTNNVCQTVSLALELLMLYLFYLH